MRTLPLPLFLLLLVGCVSSQAGLDPALTSEIPEGADVIKVYSSEGPADFYRTLYQHLASKGYEIKESNPEMLTLSTEFNEVGQETLLAIRAFVQGEGTGSVAQLRGRWGAGQGMVLFTSMMTGANAEQLQGQPARWKQRDRAGVAFGQMAALARSLPHDQISCEVESGPVKEAAPEKKGRSRGVTDL